MTQVYYVSFLLLQGLSLGRFDGMVKIGDRVQIYEAYSNYYGRCGIVIGDDFVQRSNIRLSLTMVMIVYSKEKI